MATIFAGDESGDVGLAFGRGASSHLVLALVRFQDADAARSEIEAFKKYYHVVARDLSFHELQSQRLREKVFAFLEPLLFQAWVLVVNKRILPEPFLAMPPVNLFAFILSEAISQIPLESRLKSNLVLDEFDKSGRLVVQVTRLLKARGIPRGFRKITVKRSESEPLIQVADLIAGVTYQYIEEHASPLYERVRTKVSFNEFRLKEKPPS